MGFIGQSLFPTYFCHSSTFYFRLWTKLPLYPSNSQISRHCRVGRDLRRHLAHRMSYGDLLSDHSLQRMKGGKLGPLFSAFQWLNYYSDYWCDFSKHDSNKCSTGSHLSGVAGLGINNEESTRPSLYCNYRNVVSLGPGRLPPTGIPHREHPHLKITRPKTALVLLLPPFQPALHTPNPLII